MRSPRILFVLVSVLMVVHVASEVRAGEHDASDTPTSLHRVKAGETLWALSERRYGNRHYSKIVQLYNHIDDPKALRAGDEIRLPSLTVILAEEGLTNVMRDEVSSILNARTWYMEVEERLWILRSGTRRGEVVEIPEEVKHALRKAADETERAAAGFGINKPGVKQTPTSLIGQLTRTVTNVRRIATGWSDGYGYDLDMVHQRLAWAMYYGIIWARNGFE